MIRLHNLIVQKKKKSIILAISSILRGINKKVKQRRFNTYENKASISIIKRLN